MELRDFDDIRPYLPEELPAVYERLFRDEEFCKVLGYIMPGVPLEIIKSQMMSCKTSLDFQKVFCYTFLEQLLQRASTGISMDTEAVDLKQRYTFISNHRDIVLDSAFLDMLLVDAGCDTTCEIAIGDNLLSRPWVRDLVGVNKAFIVQRSLPRLQLMRASIQLSEYMHFVINEKNDNVWIAQREGRAKDSNDRTQVAILKMMTLGGEGSIIERLRQLHLVPLSISYEYDPCDYLKAREFQLKRDIEGWKKTAEDDVLSMKTGILGWKGQIHYHCAPCIDDFLLSLPADMPKNELYECIATHIDQEIHRYYMLYPNNYIALDILNDNSSFANKYTEEDKATFEKYLEGQLAKITDVENKDEDFLRECILTMYANPTINHLTAK
ncbi:MAG: 1-acyl-sn-glycerol-3-phosphate acyltransferase [Prevotella sp.]|nr:1-acyl-sn-glycerol-3-phosphate acyltransferase [Prevotella sp.]